LERERDAEGQGRTEGKGGGVKGRKGEREKNRRKAPRDERPV
jgi:hypothetical protein